MLILFGLIAIAIGVQTTYASIPEEHHKGNVRLIWGIVVAGVLMALPNVVAFRGGNIGFRESIAMISVALVCFLYCRTAGLINLARSVNAYGTAHEARVAGGSVPAAIAVSSLDLMIQI